MKIMHTHHKDKLFQQNPNAENASENSIDDLVLDHCPSCYQTLKPKALDCASCGIILENYRRASTERKLKHTIGGLYHLTGEECVQLERAWTKIESIYHDQKLHNQFLHLCLRLKSLPFAAKKYKSRLDLNPYDDIAAMMKNRALLLASESLPTSSPAEDWVPPVLAMALFRTLILFLIVGSCAGSVLMLISALTTEKLFFFALGAFLTASCLLSAMSLLRIQRSI
jgi:hypothetical protein